jgi:hypothetical protein
MFDPEKIERFDMDVAGGEDPSPNGRYVLSSDYDQLLKLHREAKKNVRPICSHGCIEGQCAICK